MPDFSDTQKKPQKSKRRWRLKQWLGMGCAAAVLLIGAAGFVFYEMLGDWPTSRKVVKTIVSPDGQYQASVTDIDWGFSGASTLEVKSLKPSSFTVSVSRLFAHSYSDTFAQVTDIRWKDKRTLTVRYWGIPGGDGNHASSWGDIRFDNKPILVY